MQKQRKHNTNTVGTKGRQELVRVEGKRVISFIVLVVKQRTINWPTATRTTTEMIIMMKYMKFLIFIGDIWLRAKEEMRREEGEQAMLFNFETSTLSLSLSLLLLLVGQVKSSPSFNQSNQSNQLPRHLCSHLKLTSSITLTADAIFKFVNYKYQCLLGVSEWQRVEGEHPWCWRWLREWATGYRLQLKSLIDDCKDNANFIAQLWMDSEKDNCSCSWGCLRELKDTLDWRDFKGS